MSSPHRRARHPRALHHPPGRPPASSSKRRGESDPEKLKAIIGKTAKLTFQMVDDSVPAATDIAARPRAARRRAAAQRRSRSTNLLCACSVRRRVVLTGEMLVRRDVRPSTARMASSVTSISASTASGARRFSATTTTQNLQKPPLRHRAGRSSVIEATCTIQSAILTAARARSPATSRRTSRRPTSRSCCARAPCRLKLNVIVEQRTVGAELGADAVRSGAIALLHRGDRRSWPSSSCAYGLFGVFAAAGPAR